MRLLLIALVLLLVGSGLVLLRALVASLPDPEGQPVVVPSAARARLALPPETRRERLAARATVCRREGHTWRVAFPLGRLSRQCVKCGAVAAPIVIGTYPREIL